MPLDIPKMVLTPHTTLSYIWIQRCFYCAISLSKKRITKLLFLTWTWVLQIIFIRTAACIFHNYMLHATSNLKSVKFITQNCNPNSHKNWIEKWHARNTYPSLISLNVTLYETIRRCFAKTYFYFRTHCHLFNYSSTPSLYQQYTQNKKFVISIPV